VGYITAEIYAVDIPIAHQYSAFDLTARQFAVAYNFIQECAIAIADEWLK